MRDFHPRCTLALKRTGARHSVRAVVRLLTCERLAPFAAVGLNSKSAVGQAGPLSGSQFFLKISAVLTMLDLPGVTSPPPLSRTSTPRARCLPHNLPGSPSLPPSPVGESSG